MSGWYPVFIDTYKRLEESDTANRGDAEIQLEISKNPRHFSRPFPQLLVDPIKT